MAPNLSKATDDQVGDVAVDGFKPSRFNIKGKDLAVDGHPVLLDRLDSTSRPYVLLLPIIEGPFRASIESVKVEDYVDVCLESGSSTVRGSVFRSALYLHVGENPFELAKEAMKVVRAHLGTFRLLEEKTPPPPIVDKFGLCTWDAFYLKVHPEGVWEGVRRLAEVGCPPEIVLVDDSWQSIFHDEDDPSGGSEGMNRTSAGEQMPCRLIKFQENHKFRGYKGGMGGFVRELKAAFPTVEQVYVWHALCGYWGGLRSGAPGLPPAKVVPPKLSPGLQRTMEDLAINKIVNNCVGLVDPKRAHELHSHLQASGIDGVKVDVIHMFAADALPASTSANDVAAEGNCTPRPAFAMRSGEFILDSRASCHATGDMDLLVDFTLAPQTGRSVCVANGSLLPILGHGCVRLRSVTLPGVLYVPGLAMNIVSVSRLGELDYSVTFSPTRCFIWETCDGAVVGEGRRVNGLFQLEYLRVPLGRARCATCLRLGSE